MTLTIIIKMDNLESFDDPAAEFRRIANEIGDKTKQCGIEELCRGIVDADNNCVGDAKVTT